VRALSAPAIGLIPAYDSIGIAAPTLHIVFRLLQGNSNRRDRV
jgi:hypothetical protein